MKRYLSLTVLIAMCQPLAIAELSEFDAGPEDWQLITHPFGSDNNLLRQGVLRKSDIVEIMSPVVSNGTLVVPEIDTNWSFITAPRSFLGDWSNFAAAQVTISVDFEPSRELVLYIADGSGAPAANAAIYRFPVSELPVNELTTLWAPVDEAAWTVTAGTWDALIGNVQEFWVRLETVVGTIETHVVDSVETVECLATEDRDSDGVPDADDDCVLIANPDQTDSDDDGIGNACDADLNSDGIVDLSDLAILQSAFFSTPNSANWNASADFTLNGIVNVQDLAVMRASIFGRPGPSCINPD